MKLKCSKCDIILSTEIPDNTIVRAWIECPECIQNRPENKEMKKFNIYYDETIRRCIQVTADNEKEARKLFESDDFTYKDSEFYDALGEEIYDIEEVEDEG